MCVVFLHTQLPTEVDDNAWDIGGLALQKILKDAANGATISNIENLHTLRINGGYSIGSYPNTEDTYHLHREGFCGCNTILFCHAVA